ncbi:hypothetical protein NDU88_001473 [Pleurodeles waltl]|uniref:Uncharacterized protein n=1 Tax=Pleurodeles waltl TaxID=8319 RepID=A0AAV7NJ50_PLEWA|nr:hypothetical protein NDU88_001473 [Pleurodeles waltl]
MNPDFRVPEMVKVDDGLRGEEEEIEDTTEDARRVEEQTDAGGQPGEGRAGNSDVPTKKTSPVRKDSSEETRTHRHVPGGAWMNKVRSLFTGQSKRNKENGDGGEERGDGEGRVDRGTAERT